VKRLLFRDQNGAEFFPIPETLHDRFFRQFYVFGEFRQIHVKLRILAQKQAV